MGRIFALNQAEIIRAPDDHFQWIYDHSIAYFLQYIGNLTQIKSFLASDTNNFNGRNELDYNSCWSLEHGHFTTYQFQM